MLPTCTKGVLTHRFEPMRITTREVFEKLMRYGHNLNRFPLKTLRQNCTDFSPLLCIPMDPITAPDFALAREETRSTIYDSYRVAY